MADDEHIGRNWFRRTVWRPACTAAGLTELPRFHDLRHSHAPVWNGSPSVPGEHFTRCQPPLVQAAGFQVVETERRKAGTVERIHPVKPA